MSPGGSVRLLCYLGLCSLGLPRHSPHPCSKQAVRCKLHCCHTAGLLHLSYPHLHAHNWIHFTTQQLQGEDGALVPHPAMHHMALYAQHVRPRWRRRRRRGHGCAGGLGSGRHDLAWEWE